jgi:aspartyl protease family protein
LLIPEVRFRVAMPSIPDLSAQSPYFLPLLAGGLILLIILLRLPFVGALIRTLFTIALLAFVALLLIERAPYDPTLAQIASRFRLDGQQVVGDEVRIRMSPDGHFRATVSINGVRRRMLVDSGATVTALSQRTAAEAGLRLDDNILPIVLQTANGATTARTATVDELDLGNITARGLKVVVSPALGDMDLLGMNFLSKLKSWRVEEGTLVLVPHHPQQVTGS